MNRRSSAQFNMEVSGVKTTSNLDTSVLFNTTYREPIRPPIDLFSQDLADIVTLLGAPSSPVTPKWKLLANLSVLGLVSSVETYFRRVIRQTLIIDKESQIKSHDKQLSYGAAIHHAENLLPEALMEEATFSNKKNIKDNLNNFLGISVAQSPKVMSALDTYDIVCNLRHCIVHKSGKLGSKNAIRFGLHDHSDFLEKPIEVDFNSVNEIFSVCSSLVKEINDFLFIQLLNRTGNHIEWNNDLRKDKSQLKQYFDLYSCSDFSSPENLKKCHRELMAAIYTP